MSRPAPRNFRPNLHFTAPTMWLNDPNGLVLENGRYHLYYQHYPHDTVWGPMHWGHAFSSDLYHWEHCPIAMAPDELGMIFSGSAVLDTDNVSGFGKDGKAPLLIYYTSHGDQERQSMAWSLDGGMTFTRYEGNPILDNPGIRDYRDPKVFPNPVLGGFSMAVSACDRVMFYHSRDLKHWEKTGEFGPVPELPREKYLWECPDLFPLPYEGGETWVLLASIGVYDKKDGLNFMCWTHGHFDGKTFIRDPQAKMERLDQGFDCYAGSTYWGTDRRIFLGWGNCPDYAGQTPTGEYCGQMTLPRELTLCRTESGCQLAAVPCGLDSVLFAKPVSEIRLETETFCLRVQGTGAGSVTLYNENGEEVTFGIDEENRVFLDRSRATRLGIDPLFASSSICSAARPCSGPWQLDAIFDVTGLEFFTDGGTRYFSQLLFPEHPYTALRTSGAVSVQQFVPSLS